MHARTLAVALSGGLAMAVIVAVPGWAGPDTGNLMDLTTRVSQTMTGMPALPPRTLHKQVCTAPGAFDRHTLDKLTAQNQCKVTNFKQQDDTITFDEVCPAPMAMTMHGRFRRIGSAGFTGHMHAAFDAGGGHPVTVDTEYTGKRVGSCAYQPPAASG